MTRVRSTNWRFNSTTLPYPSTPLERSLLPGFPNPPKRRTHSLVLSQSPSGPRENSTSTMTSNRDRDDNLTFSNPSSSSSPITVSDQLDSYLTDPSSHIGSASGSFQNDGILGAGDTGGSSSSEAEFGFSRPDLRQSQLVGTVEFYERHVFLCYKNPRVWPPRIEAAEFDRLPRLLQAAVVARKSDMKKETRLTICEGHDGSETSNGDVLIFPDMVRYRRLTHFDVETFVEEVLVKDGDWLPGTPETLKGSYVFVCSHGSRDRRCGVCGPALITRFKEEMELIGLQGKVSVSPCSHIGGHKYAGNIIIFRSNVNGEVTGHWYGYVTPEDVPLLLHQHIGKGDIVDSLWRGQMGLSEEEQKKSQEQRLHLNGETDVRKSINELMQTKNSDTDIAVCRSRDASFGCCQGNGNSSCCQNNDLMEKISDADNIEAAAKLMAEKKSGRKNILSRKNSGKGASRKVCSMPTWIDSWEQEDTYAALAVVCAVVSVAIAYSCYKQ
ncbi:Altered inheritance of mitochondria 32 [Quillaja saponaria]|uniref:Altered inheritance of mitochondria 32 n=1 Tax=Quillaja saponaria TaxID=32244 RepID=A0AAD7PQY1_QUISA|nr:Altered inheritance of mitochondria 32 [Quillaja saponaria]